MTDFGGFPYSFPMYFGASGDDEGAVGDMFLSDFDEELIFNLIKENPRTRTRTIRNYYTPQSDYPSTIKEEIGTKELSFSGFFDYPLIESKHIRERKLDYLLRSNNKLLLINIPRDYATLFNLKNIGDIEDVSFKNFDTFNMGGSAEKQPLGQIRLAVDSRCSTDGNKVGDGGALQNRAVRLTPPSLTVADFQTNAATGTALSPEHINDNNTGTQTQFDLDEYCEIQLSEYFLANKYRYIGDANNNEDGDYKLQYFNYATNAWTDWETGIPTRLNTWSSWAVITTITTDKIRIIATTEDTSIFKSMTREWEFKYEV